MVEALRPNEFPVYVVPAQQIRYNRGSLFVRQYDREKDEKGEGLFLETRFPLSKLRSITDLALYPDRYPKAQLDYKTGLLLTPQSSLIELPNLRKSLAAAYVDYQRRSAINESVSRKIRRTYGKALEEHHLQDHTFPVPKTIRATSSFNEHGVFKLQVDGVWLLARPDSYAVTICVPVKVGKPDPEQITPQKPDSKTAISIPLAYWHNPGSEAAVVSLLAGAGRLASLAMNISPSSSATEEIAA
jgi:hypothetical protein